MENNNKKSFENIDTLFIKLCNKLKNFDKILNFSFMQLSTNFDRFKFIYSIPNVQSELFEPIFQSNTSYYYDQKDNEKSCEYRRQGNEEFRSKRFFDAIQKYNQSIRYADPRPDVLKSEKEQLEVYNELALAYANRSAVFFHLGEFGLCLHDIDQALHYGYPKRLRPRLIQRKLNCLYGIEKYDKLMQVLKSEITEENLIKHFELKIAQLKIEEQREKDLNNLNDETFEYEFYFKSYANKSFVLDQGSTTQSGKKVQSGSSSLGIYFALDKGFYLKAEKDIQVGELIVTERPYASVLLGEHFETNCFECMLKLDPLKMNLTYCSQCSTVQYCSKECENLAWNSHHKYECKFLKLLAFESCLTHMEWLALRIILKAGNEFLLSNKYDLESYEKKYEAVLNRVDSTTDSFNQQIFGHGYKSDCYLSIFNLVTNSPLRKLNDLFRRSFVALFFVKFLHKTKFINEKLDHEMNQGQNSHFIGGLLLRHLQSISCNAHEISRLKIVDEGKQPMANSFANGIGAGIYAVLSLFNHSCDPHVTRTFRGNICQVRALRPVHKNEQIYDNYGVLYAVNDLDERREKLLEQYFFECKCAPCEDNWPLYDKIPHELSSNLVKCQTCRVKKTPECTQCLSDLDNLNLLQLNAQQSLRTLLKFTGQTDLSNAQVETIVHDIYENYTKYLTALDLVKIKRPFQDYNNFEEAFKQLLNLINTK
jgi:hypothetical protein